MAALCQKNINVYNYVTFFYILRYTCLNGIYFSLEYSVDPKPKLHLLHEPHLYTQTSMPSLVLDLSMYQVRPTLIFGLNPFCHSHLSGNLTVNGLWFAISVSSCQGGQLIGPNFLADEFFVRNYLKSKMYETLSLSIYDLKL
jgi:hypothetical protein